MFSALLPEADIRHARWDVRVVPIAEVADAVAALLRKSCFAEAVDINRFPQQSTNS